jgi:hypothetical protein
MSKNVEVVERFFETVGRLLRTWRPQGSLLDDEGKRYPS